MADPIDAPRRRFGLGRGQVYPAAHADMLVHPARRLLHPPRRLVRRLDPAVDADVLELGPGPGWFTGALAASLPHGRLHLLDLQVEMLERAATRGSGRVVTATVGDACALPFADGSFDAVVASAVLGELPHPGRAVAEVTRVLRPGGRLVVLETRTDPDFVAYRRLVELGTNAGLRPLRRHGRLLGYTAMLERPCPLVFAGRSARADGGPAS